MIKKIALKGLRLSHLRQLQAYIYDRDETGWYYGNKEQFEKRHTDLKTWIDNAIEKEINYDMD